MKEKREFSRTGILCRGSMTTGGLPNGVDLHPVFSTEMHQGSSLGWTCRALGVSIHDRGEVYTMMNFVRDCVHSKAT